MQGLKIRRTAQLSFTPCDWQLYTCAFPESEMAQVAQAINAGVESAIFTSADKEEASSKADSVLVSFRKYGACDTGPRHFLSVILEKVYGNEE